MGEDGKDSSKIEPFHNLNEKYYHKVMETASLPFKQPDPLGNVLSSEISKTTVNGHEMKANVSAQKMFTGKTKVKKKMRVEDIITNLAKKVKQVANTPPKENEVKKVGSTLPKETEVKKFGSTPAKENEVKKVGSTPARENEVKKVGSTPAKENEVKKVGSTPAKENEVKKVGSTPANETEVKKVGSTLPKGNELKKVGSTPAKETEVKKVESTLPKGNELKKVGSMPAKENVAKQVGSTLPKGNKVKQHVGNTPAKENGSTPANENDLSSSGETQEDDVSSFASMCTIRNDPPEYTDLSELPPLTKQSTEQSSVLQIKKTSPGNVVQFSKIIQTTPAISNPPNPVRQIILQTVPQRTNQQTPIILNKLPPGFIIRSDLPSSSFPNLQTTSTSGQPTLLLITKSGGPIYLTQNRNTSTNQSQAKPVNKPNTSPVFTQTKPIIGSSNSSTLLKGRPINSNKSILKLTSPSKTNTETPLITVQYNLPYPNNNCKVVNNPVNIRTAQNLQPGTFRTLGNIPGTNKVLVTEIPRPSRPREMVVNFAGNQTAHITTMTDETSVIPERQTRFIPSFLYGSPPDTTAIKKTKPSPVAEKRNDKTIFIVTSPSAVATNAKQKINPNNKVAVQSTQRKSIYDEKIAQLTGKMTNINQAVAVNGKAKTLSNVLQKKSNVVINNVRVSNRKRQQTERAKLFEKETKKRKRSDEKSPGKEKTEKANLDAKVKVEKPDDYNITSPKVVSPSKHQSPSQILNKSPSKKSKTVPQQTLVKNDTVPVKEKEKEDDPDSLFRDPALLTREERALQRALMMFKELEEKQARKESVSDTERTSSRKSVGTIQFNKTSDVQRKRKVSNEDVDDIVLKKRKREIRKQSIEKKINEVQSKDADQGHKDSEVIVKTIIKQENLATDNPDRSSVHSNENGKRKEIRKKITVPKKTEIKPDTIKDSPNSTKEHKHLKTVKDVIQTPKVLKLSPKIPDSAAERHRVKTYMLVPSYHGFKDFSPIVLGSRTRSRKTEPVKTEKEDDVPVTKPPEKSENDIPLLVIETVGNKAVKQDVVAKDEQLRDFVKNSIRKQGMLKQELELSEKNEDAEQFENREKRNLTVNRNTGETVLHKASRMGYDETVYHCIQQGSDSNAKDNAGWTPLHEACSRGHSDVVRVLVKYNADVNACSNDGIRPIHDAADNGKIDSLRLLMAYGADPFISTYSGHSVVDCAKRTEAKDYIKACIGDLYLNDERNTVASVDHENRWDFRGSSSILDKDRKYFGDIFDNVPKQQSNNSVKFEWSETPHLPTYSLPLVKDGIVVGRKNYILFHDLQETLNKPRQNVVRLLKRTKIREISLAEFKKEVSSSYFNKLSECPPGSEEGKVELVPLNWTVRSLLKIKCEHLAL